MPYVTTFSRGVVNAPQPESIKYIWCIFMLLIYETILLRVHPKPRQKYRVASSFAVRKRHAKICGNCLMVDSTCRSAKHTEQMHTPNTSLGVERLGTLSSSFLIVPHRSWSVNGMLEGPSSSSSSSCFLSPIKTISATKRLPSIHDTMSGTKIMNTTRKPFILASKMADSNASDPSSPICQLPTSTRVRSDEGTLLRSDEAVAAYWAAVDTATPTTAPRARNRLRVDVATARSSLRESACRATRPI